MKTKQLKVIEGLCCAVQDGMDKDKALNLIYKFAHINGMIF